ncbi:MAG: hypothetical protein COA43_10530 [Robiginitomaculum sp.]|nr:MAG: hypothetical protein COA43_10530 [Robiginitomaculum sp.]
MRREIAIFTFLCAILLPFSACVKQPISNISIHQASSLPAQQTCVQTRNGDASPLCGSAYHLDTGLTSRHIPQMTGLRGIHRIDTMTNTPAASQHPYTYKARMHHESANASYVNIGGIKYDLGSEIHGIQGRLGYSLTPNIGVEIEASVGTDLYTYINTKFGVEYSAGAFVVGRVPVSENISMLARGGYHTTNFDTDSGALTSQEGRNGFAYGAGVEYAFNSINALRLDLTKYAIKYTDIKGNSASVSYVRKF